MGFFTNLIGQQIELNSSYPVESVNSWEKVRNFMTESGQKEAVFIDNANIHTYKGRQGIWKKVPYGTELAQYIFPYGATEEEVIELNQLPLKTKKIFNSQWLFIPFSQSHAKELETQGITRISWESNRDELIWPVEGVRITSRLGQRWGKFHPGMDIAAASGTMVLAAMDGEVTEARYFGDYGNMVMIGSDNSTSSLYAHLSEIFVKKGDIIKKGQVIGLSGNSGRSTGPHLHFEVRYMNVILNPEVFLPAFKESIYAFVKPVVLENLETE